MIPADVLQNTWLPLPHLADITVIKQADIACFRVKNTNYVGPPLH